MTPEQISTIRNQFPILNKQINGYPLCYFDNGATTQKPKTVIDAISYYYNNFNSNIHRGIHTLSNQSTILWESAHMIAAQFIGASSEEEVIFVKNTTEGINIAAHSFAQKNIKKGDVIAVTEMEHHSNILPWRLVAENKGANLEWIPVTDDYKIDINYLEFLIRKYKERLKVVSVVHVSNVLGTENDLEKIIKLAHSVGAIVLVDGAQSTPHIPIDVKKLDCDFFVFSGHKMYMPTGTGILYGKKELLTQIDPFIRGGGMITNVTKNTDLWTGIPWKFEAGTPDIADGIALGVGLLWFNDLIKYLGGESKGIDTVENYFSKMLAYAENSKYKTIGFDKGFELLIAYEKKLMSQLIHKLTDIKRVSVFGDTDVDKRIAVLSFITEGVHPHDLASLLDEKGIAIRAGMHCAHPLHRRFDLEATSRISLDMYNTMEEVDHVANTISEVTRVFNQKR